MVTTDGLLAPVFSLLLCRLCLQPRTHFSLEDVRNASRLNGEGQGGGGEPGGPIRRGGQLLEMIYAPPF